MSIDARTREAIRKAHADMLAARERADKVTRPDGTDGHGYPAVEAANLEGFLGRFAIPLLDALEEAEAGAPEAMVEQVHVAGAPATLTARASVLIDGVDDPVALPLTVGGSTPGGIALVLDPGPAMDALMDARDKGKPS